MYGVMPAFVLYAKDPAATRRFYETVGLAFVEERHGEGPLHYSCDFQGIILEIYPLKEGTTAKPCNTVAFVLFVDLFDQVLAALKAVGAKPGAVGPYVEGTELRAVNVRDPEGLLVRILERDPVAVQ